MTNPHITTSDRLAQLIAPWLCAAALISGSASVAAEEPVRFNRDIRPILSTHCFECHGPDAQQREAELRLDVRDSAIADRDGSIAIVPGDSEASVLVERITNSDEDLRMPPADREPLADEQQQLLRRWIAEGADYERHWSYVPPMKSTLPEVSHPEWVRNPIDRFVMARLDAEGLQPAPAAERHTLIRRVALALTGLPPTLDEIERFNSDATDDAYAAMVDRYLRSDAYGERWAAVWLDLARYADSAGYAQDPVRTIWPYRDWVIRAINRNLSFDRFTIEQLAGDMLPGPTQDQLIATGFHRNTMTNSEGGTDDEEFRNVAIVDRVNTTMQVWMGVTIGCAQCHDHKFDPITNEEYFRFFAILNNTADSDKGDEQPTIPVMTPDLEQKQDDLRRQISELEELIAQRTETEPSPLTGPLHPRYIRIELPGENKILSLAEVQVFSESKNVARDAKASQSSVASSGPPELAIDGKTSGDYFAAKSTTHTKQEQDPWWEADLGQATRIERIAIWNRTDGGLFVRLAGCRIVLLDESRRALWIHTLATPPEVSTELAPPQSADELSEDDRQAIATYDASSPDSDDPDRKRLAGLKKQLAGMKPYTTPIMRELAAEKRRETFIQIRGNFLNTSDKVAAGVPSVFHPLPDDAEPTRLALAAWLVDRDNPLTARVLVNRYWDQLFGRGLVTTAEEFGNQGEPPSHPKLLDHLAVELIEQGWDTRWLIRRIVNSATFQQSARATPELIARDPDNQLLARGPRFRLSAEMIRDQALAIAGLLSPKMYGPPVQPPRPNLGLRSAFGGLTDWKTSAGEDRYRRALYTNWRRTTPYPSMTTFDSPSREFCSIRRIRTNTPLQALVTLNDPAFVEAAQGLARRIVAEGGDSVDTRAEFAIRACLARPATESELEQLTDLYAQSVSGLSDSPSDAANLATDPIGPAAGGADVLELAGWTVVGNVLMNLDEFLTRP